MGDKTFLKMHNGRGQGDAGTCPELERRGGKPVANRRLSPQPGAPGHHILPVGLRDLWGFFSDLLCQDPSSRPGEEVNLATAGKDTMSQW